jgi:actin-related protein
MFEYFHVPCLYLGIQSVLALYASGRTTGLVVDTGEGVTHTVPIYEGFAVPHAIPRIPLAGCDLTVYFQELLKKLGYNFTTPDDIQAVNFLKEKDKLCEVALDYDATIKEGSDSKIFEKKEELPDGHAIVIGIERFQVPEVLFQPQLAAKQNEGIQKHADESIKKCDQDIRKDLYKNIILSGGSSMFQGMKERLKKEVKKLAQPMTEVEVFAPPERKYSVWIGGSIVASLSTFPAMYISRNEYNEVGAEIVHRKCF